MIGPSFYWNPHSACRLFKCQQLMGEWISDANSRMLISFTRMNILFRHQERAFPWITWKTLEKYFWNTDQRVSFQAGRSMMCGRKTLVEPLADLFFRKNLPPSGWDPICVGGKRWSGPCQGLHWSLFKWNRSLASDNIVMNYRCAVCAQNLHICACRYVRSKCKIYWNTL